MSSLPKHSFTHLHFEDILVIWVHKCKRKVCTSSSLTYNLLVTNSKLYKQQMQHDAQKIQASVRRRSLQPLISTPNFSFMEDNSDSDDSVTDLTADTSSVDESF